MASFVENLRMGSIYNPFAGNQSPNYIQQDPITTFATRIQPLVHAEQDRNDMRQFKFMDAMRNAQLQEQQSKPSKPMNTVFHEDIGPLDKAKLDLERQRIDTTRDIASGKLGFQHEKQDTDAAIRQHRAETYDRLADIRQQIADSKMSEEDKLRLTNQLNEHMQWAKGEQALEQIGARGYQARETEGVRQTGRSALETQKQAGRVELKTTQGPIVPTQQRALHRANAEKFRNENPDMAEYVELDPDDPLGFNVNVPEDMPPAILHRINSSIYGSNYGQDVNLPAGSANPPSFTNQAPQGATPSYTNKAPTTTKPTTAKPKILSITPIGGK